MKFLDIQSLSRLAESLSHDGPECSVRTRIEAYSCKNIKRDKKLFKSLETAYKDDVSPLPSWLALDHEAEMTPFGPMNKQSSRKTLYLLIATLNVAFPDHEFSDVRPGHFSKEESGASVLNSLSTTLVAPHRAGQNAPRTYSSYPTSDFLPSTTPTSSSSSPLNHIVPEPTIVTGTHPTIFRIIDDSIGLSDCEVYSYSPEIDADPHAVDFDDDEELRPVADDEESAGEDGPFEFDDYDIDESQNESVLKRFKPPPTPRVAIRNSLFSFRRPSLDRRGGLLWSSHWFFFNRKQKRVLFISIWARARRTGAWEDVELLNDFEEEEAYFGPSSFSERFHGWEGDVGAGARAMGL